MAALTRTTELEAVNTILRMMGEAPINSLESGFGLGEQAEAALLDASRKIQMENWSFNTDYSLTLTFDSNGYIYIPSTALRVEVNPFDYPDFEVIQRGNRLYEKRSNTYVFTQNLIADVTHGLPWEELPEHARHYITAKAGRDLQMQVIGSKDLNEVNYGIEIEARAAFLDLETTLSNHSLLQGNPSVMGNYFSYVPANALRRK
tara:strand:- start:171 stop:782 length:612 start_codon:yes stop_codon:yes gene_type:complete